MKCNICGKEYPSIYYFKVEGVCNDCSKLSSDELSKYKKNMTQEEKILLEASSENPTIIKYYKGPVTAAYFIMCVFVIIYIISQGLPVFWTLAAILGAIIFSVAATNHIPNKVSFFKKFIEIDMPNKDKVRIFEIQQLDLKSSHISLKGFDLNRKNHEIVLPNKCLKKGQFNGIKSSIENFASSKKLNSI